MSKRWLAEPLCITAIVWFGLALMPGTAAHAQGPVTNQPDPARGQALAERVCSNCHLVSERQSKANVDVPSFAAIANKPEQSAGAIMARIIVPKHPMPVIPITKAELEDVSAYIMSLRDN